ncbi:MAG: class I SAM-dependent methyltransferase [Candidatus Omnitrophota bacterium]
MTHSLPDKTVAERLREYYRTSGAYRDDLLTHGEKFLEPFLILVGRYARPPARILDIGCGTALSTRLLSQMDYEAVGVDLSPLFLSEEKRFHPETVLAASDALRLPFPDETFDAVVAFEFIEHVPNVPACLDEIARVLKIRGHIVIHSPNLLSPYLPAFDLLRMSFGGEGRPVFAETIPQAWRWFWRNLLLSLWKKISLRPHFLYREPDLSGSRIGGDADSVYLACPLDLTRHLRRRGFAIDQAAHAMSLKNKFAAALTPNFAPYMGVAAHKTSRAKKDVGMGGSHGDA